MEQFYSSDDERRNALRAAVNHNASARNMASCNQPYMGSMAIASLMTRLGGLYGRDNLELLIAEASTGQLRAAIKYCAAHGYLQRAKL